jgi:ribonuclease kappa
MIILGVLAILFNSNHHELVGSEEDPENGPAVAGTIFTAILVYAVRFLSQSHRVKKKNYDSRTY